MKRFVALFSLTGFLAGCTAGAPPAATPPDQSAVVPTVTAAEPAAFGDTVKYQPNTTKINPAIAAPFSVDEVKDVAAIEKAYGFAFTPAERAFLAQNKFVLKKLTDTSIVPKQGNPNNSREFPSLYNAIRGSDDARDRGPQNALFFSADVFFHTYNNLYTELMREMENKYFYASMKDVSKTFYTQAAAKASAASGDEKAKWTKVRDYFAVPYAILSTAESPLTDEQLQAAQGQDPEALRAQHAESDKTIDTEANVAAFLKTLKLGASEEAVLADVHQVYAAEQRGVPALFETEYQEYTQKTHISFETDWTQFTPRSHYTSSSLRRQYFRAMNWYIQLPFFLGSPALTQYAFGITQLMAENPQQLQAYNTLESAINFLVGTSDDLMPADYLQALQNAKGKPDQEAVVMDYLAKARNPKIKSIPARYETVGGTTSAQVLDATKGMRFFSGKFIVDSYWTDQLTQGDEAPLPGYAQKLPPMASSLEVMALLGSDYARTKIPTLEFFNPAVAQMMDQLTKETASLTDQDWTQNLYTSWLWTIRSLFGWQKEHRAELPQFMQSAPWEIKTLQTASAFWTELRHATLLYAKQSFAELGGGGGVCDTRQVPPPAKGYVEPQLEAYQKLLFLAQRTEKGMKDQQFDLQNMVPLHNFIDLMQTVQSYVEKELQNATLAETVKDETGPDPNVEGKPCTQHLVQDGSDWEVLRLKIVDGLAMSLPQPLEGDVLPAKDRRAALVADVHTGGDSLHPPEILYEGTGVPYVIFTAVKDANGPRLTVGFTYAHYEFRKPYGGQRLTDEEWQNNFYVGDDDYNAYQHTDAKTWPVPNAWYAPILELR